MHKLIRNFLIAGVITCSAIPVLGQEEVTNDEPIDESIDVTDGEKVGDAMRSCVTLRALRRTEIIDDRNILFRMRGRTIYHNILPRQCGGLAREDRFSYDSSMGRLCRGDMIRVLHSDSFGTYGMREGVACRLGAFHKISQEDAQALREAPVRQPSNIPLPMPSPQEVGADPDEPEEAEPELR